ncbi:hypothetical protein Tco_0554651 [Tanacetum coccineum]
MDQLKEGHQGPIVVMICREWDLHNINGKYLSTNIVVSDEKENVIHSTMKSNVSHCFIDNIKEGNVVSMRHPFQLMEFEAIQPTEKKYMIDVTGYITNVGKSVHVTPRQWQKLENAT